MQMDLEDQLAGSLARHDATRIGYGYWRLDELLTLEAALPDAWMNALRREVLALEAKVKRKSIWGYKAAGSLAHSVLAQHAPSAAALYRSPALLRFLSKLCDQPLTRCPDDDAHACAVYWYDRPGDRIGFHYDTSFYRGARYTLLLGVHDDSSARLMCRVHSRDRHRKALDLAVQTTPGKLVFFNGDKLLHAVSPLGSGELRIVLSMQFVTDPSMSPVHKLISSAKDALAYFGADAFKAARRLPAPG
jgi:hypothetical protein